MGETWPESRSPPPAAPPPSPARLTSPGPAAGTAARSEPGAVPGLSCEPGQQQGHQRVPSAVSGLSSEQGQQREPRAGAELRTGTAAGPPACPQRGVRAELRAGPPACPQRVPSAVHVPTMLRLLLLAGILGCGAEQAAPLAFTMLQLTRVYRGNSMFRGNASLNGQLSHVLEGNNVTQVIPLESPDAWARRQDEVIAYLSNFRQLVMLFNKERPTDFTHHLCCHLGCRLYPNGTAQSFYEVTLNRTAFLSFHVPSATWERRWPGELPVAAFAQAQLMKYPITTQDLQYFLNTTCVNLLQAQSARTGRVSGRSRTPLVLGLVLGSLGLLGMALGIFLCTGGSC
uniref:EPCR protein n=1 Tax=Junco hyemalis TaxID=40217 RepID=A0A8C5JRM2_JUNHY